MALNKIWFAPLLCFFFLFTLHAKADLDIISSPQAWDHVTMTGKSAWPVDRSEDRIQSRTGPGTQYAGGGAYKNSKITSLTVFFLEKSESGAWVYTELEYSNGYKRRLYFRPNAIHYTAKLSGYEYGERAAGTLNRDAVPVFGPGYEYDDLRRDNKSVTLPQGHPVTVLCEENGYLYIDCDSVIGQVRIWVPADAVTVS